MSSRTYIGLETRNSWTGHGRQDDVYGARIAHRFMDGKLGSLTASIEGAGTQVTRDTNAVHASVGLAYAKRLTSVLPKLSVCASSGLEIRALDFTEANPGDEDEGFVSIPLTMGLGYDVSLGALTLTPFVSPTIARYEFKSEGFANGAKQRGWDRYVTMGASLSLNRFSINGAYRNGDMSLGESGRWSFGSGVSF
jgi:hypothetical protein